MQRGPAASKLTESRFSRPGPAFDEILPQGHSTVFFPGAMGGITATSLRLLLLQSCFDSSGEIDRSLLLSALNYKLMTSLERCISQSWRKDSLWEFKGLFILLKLKTNKKTIRLIEINGVSSLMVSVVDGGLKYKYKNKTFK